MKMRPMPGKSSHLETPAANPGLWPLEKATVFLNHGSFGSCPKPVLAFQARIRQRLERQPVTFMVRELEGLLDDARTALAQFVGAEPANLVFVPNATAGVNTVLRSLKFRRGDELLVTDQEYNACRNALNFVAEQAGAKVVVVNLPFPINDVAVVVDRILARVSPRTQLALLDHVTSQTGLILPCETLVDQLTRRSILTLIDGAHAPGMVPLNLKTMRATFYTGNCHKWICAPKGAGFLCVAPEFQNRIRPLSISHGANSPRTDRSRFLLEFAWTGTWDPSAYLSVPEALRFMGSMLPGGWQAIMKRNRHLALAARELLCAALQVPPPCPADCIGALASIPLPPGASSQPPLTPLYLDPLQDRLLEKSRIEVPIIPWPAPPQRLLRISAQLYNSLPQYRRLAEALRQHCSS